MIKKRIIILVVLIAALLATYVGITYAAFTSNVIQTNDNIITTTDCLSITFQSVNSPLNLTNSYPMKDEVAQNKTPYTFTITNGCNQYLAVNLGFEIASTSTLTSSQVKATIARTGTLSAPDLLSNRTTATPIREGEDARVLYTDDLLPNESKTYDFRMWLNHDEVAANVVGKGMSGTVIVAGTIKKDNTLRSALMSNTANFLIGDAQSVYTDPGTETATQNEGLRSTADDYGTSYYYRGAVNNNYVEFAGMCWRIVRIDGHGNVKLVLFNQNVADAAKPCEATGVDAYIHDTNGTVIKESFNDRIDPNSSTTTNGHIGFMYGTINSTPVNNTQEAKIAAYDAEHMNTNKSSVLLALETWYVNNLNGYTNYLADVIWCNDKSLSTIQLQGKTGYSNLGYNYEQTFYGTGTRLFSATASGKPNTASPSLTCPDASGSDKNLSRFTVYSGGNNKLTYPIGLLTADEVTFAGSCFGMTACANSDYYLNENANTENTYWYTMSPAYLRKSSSNYVTYELAVPYGGGMAAAPTVNSYQVRPAISLKNTTTIVKGGDGTKTNPYVVN